MATSQVTGKPFALACLINSTDAPDDNRPKCARTLVASIISKYFAMATVSANAGIIGKP